MGSGVCKPKKKKRTCVPEALPVAAKVASCNLQRKQKEDFTATHSLFVDEPMSINGRPNITSVLGPSQSFKKPGLAKNEDSEPSS